MTPLSQQTWTRSPTSAFAVVDETGRVVAEAFDEETLSALVRLPGLLAAEAPESKHHHPAEMLADTSEPVEEALQPAQKLEQVLAALSSDVAAQIRQLHEDSLAATRDAALNDAAAEASAAVLAWFMGRGPDGDCNGYVRGRVLGLKSSNVLSTHAAMLGGSLWHAERALRLAQRGGANGVVVANLQTGRHLLEVAKREAEARESSRVGAP